MSGFGNGWDIPPSPSLGYSFGIYNLVGDGGLLADNGATDNSPLLQALVNNLPDSGSVFKLWLPPPRVPGAFYGFQSPVTMRNVFLEGDGIDTMCQVTSPGNIDHLFLWQNPPGTPYTYHMFGVRGVKLDGNGKTTSYIAELIGLDFIADRIWINNSGGDGLRAIGLKGIVERSFFENCGAGTALAMGYSELSGAFAQLESSVIRDNYWQSNRHDLGAWIHNSELYGNVSHNAPGIGYNWHFNASYSLGIHDNVFFGAGGGIPVIHFSDLAAGTATKKLGFAININDNINYQAAGYFVSTDAPSGGNVPVPKYVYGNRNAVGGTAFVNTPSLFELIENNTNDDLSAFGVATPAVPATGVGYTNVTGHRLKMYILTAAAASYTLTDLKGNVSPAIPAVAGAVFEILPGEIVTPTYTTLTWRAYAT